MNKYTLRFENQSMEDLYLEDQFKELFNFYTWACFLGSISAFSVFCLEFLVPFGFNEWAYTLLLIPFAFALSRKFIEVFPQYFNITLAIINILLGILISVLLYKFSNSNILFLAGQTVAMVQQSLMLGSNIMINILILLINQIGLMILGSFVQNYFNSLQLMFILSLILVIKSVWSNEKMKRNFFLLKHQNFQLHKHLDNVFQLKILRCKLEQKIFKFNLLSKNKQAEHLIKDQKDFTHFIREYVQVFIRTQTLQGQLQTPRKISLEQVLFKMIEIEDNEKTIQIYSYRTKIAFKITIYKIIENEETNLILLLQEDIDYEKVMKLNQQLKKSQIIQKKLFECQESVQQSFKSLKYYVHFLEVKGHPYQNKEKKTNSIQNNSIKFLDNSQNLLLKSIYGYYNCLIYNNELFLFKKIINFSKKRLIAEFCRLKRIFEMKRTVKIKSDQTDFNMESNLTLLLQLLLNLITEQFRFREYEAIDINMSPIQVEGFKVIIFKLTLIYSLKNEQSMDYDNTFQYDLVNQKILKQIGWKKEIRIVYEQTCDIIEFQLLQSVIDFSK